MLRDYIELPLSVRILCLGTLINRAGSSVLIFLAIYASEQLGFGVPFATACIGVLGAGAMLGSLLGGHLADKVGRRVVMLIAMFGGGALLMLLSQMTSRGGFMLTVGALALMMGAPMGGEILHRYGAMTLWISAALAMLGVALYAFIHAPISVRIALAQQPGVADVGDTQLGDVQLGDIQRRSA